MAVSSARRRARGAAPVGGEAHGLDDALVARAAAQVGGDGLADLRLGRGRVLGEQLVGDHQHAGRAEAALEPLRLAEGLLQRAQAVGPTDPFHGEDLRGVGAGGEHETGPDGLAVDEHGARAAHAVLAADVRAGEAQGLADHVDEQPARLDGELVANAVDGQGDGDGRRHAQLPVARSAAMAMASRVKWWASLLRKAAEPCTSAGGLVASAARRAASSIAAPDGAPPSSASSAARARIGVGPTPQSAMRARSQRPDAPSVTRTATPTRAKSPARRAISVKAPPVPRGASGTRTSTSISPAPSAVLRGPTKKRSAGTVRRLPARASASSASRATITAGSSEAGSAWARLPPMVPRWRMGRWPMNRHASARMGARACTSREVSTACWRASAPMARPSALARMYARSPMRLMSTSALG